MVSAENEEVQENKEINWMWGGLMAAVLIIWAGMGYYANSQGENRGTFGDMFGAVNALFTGLAFAGIIMTIRLQMKELKLQRMELKDTRGELRGQKEQLALQASTLQRQAADANFFRMLEIFRAMAIGIRHPGGCPEEYKTIVVRQNSGLGINYSEMVALISGVEYWRLLVKVCQHGMQETDTTPINEKWDYIYRRWDTSLSPYFATLSELLALIAVADVDVGRRWANILRAQFGLQEMLIIFLYGLSPVGQQRVKPYVEKFGLFAHFSDDPAYSKIAPRNWYLPGAFLPQGTN